MMPTEPRGGPDIAALVVAVLEAPTAPAARDPLTALLVSADPRPALVGLEQAGGLARFLPEVAALRGVSQLPDHAMDALDHSFTACAAAPPTPLSRWTALLHDVGKVATGLLTPEGRRRFFGHELVGADLATTALARLGFPPDFIAAVAQLIRLHLRPLSYRREWTDGAIVRLLAEAGPLWPALLAQGRADLLGYAPEPVERALANLEILAARAERITHPPPPPPGSPLDGNELQALFGRPPGPWLRPLKAALDAAVRAGTLAPDDKAAAAALARQLAGEG
ncbi:MAG TPA: HD domain-containing protein [Chloroflexia bacterium]|nr:HD domain-containing protein [Chloroflexia bacterium]